MASIKAALGGVTAITLTGASMPAYASREGTLVVNTVNLYLDAILSGHIVMGAGVPTGDIFISLSSSDGTDISTPATGSDAAIAISVIPMQWMNFLQTGQKIPGTELIFLTKINCAGAASGATIKYGNISVAQAFGGNLPPQWAPVIHNCTGLVLSATASVTNYNGVSATSV
jgi:hypothetical protein